MHCKYVAWYIQLVRNRQNNPLIPKENHKHHIFPKSIFGKIGPLVVLTPREHFVAHRLLVKIMEYRYGLNHQNTRKMNHAFSMMATYEEIQNNSRMYSLACTANSNAHKGKIISNITKERLSQSHSGNKHYCYGTHLSEETKYKISKSKLGIPLNSETVVKMKSSISRLWKITTPNNTIIQITNLYEYCKLHNLDSGNMSRVAQGKLKQHKGYTCLKLVK